MLLTYVCPINRLHGIAMNGGLHYLTGYSLTWMQPHNRVKRPMADISDHIHLQESLSGKAYL